MEPVNAKRVVLAYSGGLDTSVAVRWIQEEWGAEVVAMAVDVGQEPDADAAYWEAIRQRAFAAGAIEAHRRRRARGVRRASTSPTRSRPTRSTRASTRSCRRCRAR